jgi:ATP-dependent helicase/DNAse subunit B
MFFSNSNDYLDIIDVIDSKKDNDDIFLITSTEKLSQKYNFDLLQNSGHAFNNTNIYSFNNFISELFEKNYKSKVIDELQYNNLIINSLNSSDNKDNYNFIKQIGSQINGLRRDGINSDILFENLNDKANKSQFDTDKLSSLANILKNYERSLNSKNLTDLHTALKIITNDIENQEYLINKTFIFDEFILFSIPELEFLKSIAQDNKIIIRTNWDNINPENRFILISDLLEIGLKLFDSHSNEIKTSEINDKIGFVLELESLSKKQQNIELFKYSNIREEVFGVTQLVKYLLNKKGLQPSEICVVSRQSDDYSQLFKEFFADNKIPTNINDRLELSKSPVITSIISILEAIDSDFSFDSLEGLLASPYVDLGIENKSNILSLAKTFRIIGGIPDKGFTQFLDILRTRIVLYEKANQSNDNYFLSREEKSLLLLNEKFTRINNLFKDIDQKKDYTTTEFIELLYLCLSRFNIKQSILKLDKFVTNYDSDFTNKVFYTEKIESDSRALYKFTELIDKIAVLDDFDFKKPLSEHLKSLKGLLSITKFQIREKKKFGVDVTSIEQVRGLDYKVKILVGAVENKLPLPFGTDKLLGLVLPDSEERHYYNEYMQFYDFINDNTKKYIFRYHSDDSQIAIESHFISPFINVNYHISNELNSTISDINPTEEWQKSIINIRDTIDSFDTGNKDNNTRLLEFLNSNDLNVTLNMTDNEIENAITNTTFSVTELNSITSYKYDHFYERVLGLKKPDDIEIYFTRLEFGNLIHSVTENTLIQFKSQIKTQPFECNDREYFNETFKVSVNDKNGLIELFKNNLSDVLGRYKNKHKYYELEKIYLLGDDNKDGLLVLWFDKLLSDIISENNFSILAMEHKFNDVSIELEGKQFKFKGKIDRIDISDDRKYYKIIDYKTSEPSKQDSTQLIVYSEVVKKLLKECGYNSEPKELQYFYFNYNEKYKSNVIINDKELEKIHEKLINLINLNYSKFKENTMFESMEMNLLKRN